MILEFDGKPKEINVVVVSGYLGEEAKSKVK